eukprot:COSAG01_NODE_1258_length_11012_cov_18.155136_6_plen_110_part_00
MDSYKLSCATLQVLAAKRSARKKKSSAAHSALALRQQRPTRAMALANRARHEKAEELRLRMLRTPSAPPGPAAVAAWMGKVSPSALTDHITPVASGHAMEELARAPHRR